MKKRVTALCLTAALVSGILAGCGGGAAKTTEAPAQTQAKSAKEEGTQAEGAKAETPAAELPKVNVKIGYELNPGEPADLGANAVKTALESDGTANWEVVLYPSSQLGNKSNLIDQMLAGDSVVTVADGLYLSDFVPDFSILFGPFLFDTWDDAWATFETDWFESINAELETKGLKVIGADWIYGERYTMSSKPIHVPDDFKGTKIRVNAFPIQIKTFSNMGAAPTPMALGDVYTGLQQGTIDGLENTFTTMYNNKFHEVCKYIVRDGMVKNISLWICGADFYNSLTAEQQEALINAMHEGAKANNEAVETTSEECLKLMKEAGVEVYELSDEELALWKEATSGVYADPEVNGSWSTPDLYNVVRAAIGK